MLNTSLHNPNVQFKPSVDQFISMNHEIDDGQNIPEALLRSLFDRLVLARHGMVAQIGIKSHYSRDSSILSTPFKIADDESGMSLAFFNPERAGNLTKEGKYADVMIEVLNGWVHEVCVLVYQCIRY